MRRQLPGRPASVRQWRDSKVNWRAICGTNFKLQSIGSDPVGWIVHIIVDNKQNKTKHKTQTSKKRHTLNSHWTQAWYTLELLLPRFDQVGGLTEILDFVAFSVRHTAGQRVCSRGRLSNTTPQVSQAVVDQSFRPGVLIGDSPGTLSVRDHILLSLRGFPFELRGLVARLPHFSTSRFMSRLTVTDFPEGAAQFCTRCFMGGPAVRNSSEALAKSSQVHSSSSCKWSWSFWALSSSSALLKPLHITHPLFVVKRHLFHGDFEDSVLLSQSVQGLYCSFGSYRRP